MSTTTLPGHDPTAHSRLGVADFSALGTAVRLVVTDLGWLDQARALLDEELAAIDAACSRFRPDSELVAVSDARGHPVRVSPLLAEAVAVALRAASVTDGAVDPTVGVAMEAIGYDRTFTALAVDGPALPIVVRPVPGWRLVRVERSTRMLTVPAGIHLDLGATAKALAADRAAAAIGGALPCGVLVSLGGDVAIAGPVPDGGWVIRVQDLPGLPGEPADADATTISLATGALATSSTAARRWVRGGQVLHHLIDPRSGRPARSPWRTVSVAAATCVDANIASTATIVRGQAGLRWLTSLGLPARCVGVDGRVVTLSGWPTPSQP